MRCLSGLVSRVGEGEEVKQWRRLCKSSVKLSECMLWELNCVAVDCKGGWPTRPADCQGEWVRRVHGALQKRHVMMVRAVGRCALLRQWLGIIFVCGGDDGGSFCACEGSTSESAVPALYRFVSNWVFVSSLVQFATKIASFMSVANQ